MRDAILPLNPNAPEQLPLWQERVRLDEGFYQSLIEHPLPLREAAIRQISNRSMAIDLYVWLAYCVFRSKSAGHSEFMSATDSDLMSAVPI